MSNRTMGVVVIANRCPLVSMGSADHAEGRMNSHPWLAGTSWRATLAGVAALLSLACGQTDSVDQESLLVPWSSLSGRIAYVRGNNELLVIDPTRQQVRVIFKSHPDYWIRDVTWHPSGSSLTATVFQVYPVQVWSLAAIDAGTGAKTDMYSTMTEPRFAAWSPSGRVAFKASGPPFPGGIYIDGVLVPPDVADLAALNAPSWSPDGSKLAVVEDSTSNWHGYGDLRLLDVASGTSSALGPVLCRDPRYSPDGNRIAFARVEEATGSSQLWIATVPGGVESHLSGSDGIQPVHPDWSPDGTRLVVHSEVNPSAPELYLVDATTGALVKLTSKGGHSPAWIP